MSEKITKLVKELQEKNEDFPLEDIYKDERRLNQQDGKNKSYY